jgi:hypothetical protein
MALAGIFGSKTAMFAFGALAVPALNAVAPVIGNALRPVLKEAIKGGIVAGRALQTIAQEAWQDVEDLTAEAHAELNSEGSSENGTATKSS